MKTVLNLAVFTAALMLFSTALANDTYDDPTSITADLPIKIGNDKFSISIEQTRGYGTTEIRFIPSGFQVNNIHIEEADAAIYQAFVSDFDADGNDEFYFVTLPVGSGGYSDIIAYEANGTLGLKKISYVPFDDTHKAGVGYMGHDKFKFSEDGIYNSFPLYYFDDPNCCPSGGKRTVKYELITKKGKKSLRPTKFWGNEITEPDPKNPDLKNSNPKTPITVQEAPENIQKRPSVE